MERIVRNNTRKSSLFKIQAERNRFEEHLGNFADCKLFRLFPECQKHKESLKDLTQTLIEYSFETTHKSPFFRGMNYNGNAAGFAKGETEIVYREWLPGVKQAELLVNFGQARYLMEEQQEGMFAVSIAFEGEMRNFQDCKIQLRVVDEEDKEYVMVPPSVRIMQYDERTKAYYGIYKESQVQDDQIIEQTDLLAYEIDTHAISLKRCNEIIPYITKSKFNTVILKNLFEFKDPSFKYSILNKFSLKLSPEDINLLYDFLKKMKFEKIKVMFQINFDVKSALPPSNLFQKAYLSGDSFNLKDEGVTAFLLSTLSSYLKEFHIEGYKIIDVQKIIINGSRQQQNIRKLEVDDFLARSKKEGMLFLRMITMMIKRVNNQNISCCTTDYKIPGLSLPLDEGGFGFTFSAKSSSNNDRDELKQRVSQNYYNVEAISKTLPAIELSAISFISKKGILFQDQDTFTEQNPNKDKEIQSLKQSNYFRTQSEYFCEDAHECLLSEKLLSFRRSKFEFVYNFDSVDHKYVVDHDKTQLVYGGNGMEEEHEKEETVEMSVQKESLVILEISEDE